MAKYKVAGTMIFRNSTREDCKFATVIKHDAGMRVLAVHERRDLAQVKVDWMKKFYPDIHVVIMDLIKVEKKVK